MDEAAMREMWQFKGASGIQSLVGYAKTSYQSSWLRRSKAPILSVLIAANIDCCQFVTNEEVWEAHDHLQSIYRNVPKKNSKVCKAIWASITILLVY